MKHLGKDVFISIITDLLLVYIHIDKSYTQPNLHYLACNYLSQLYINFIPLEVALESGLPHLCSTGLSWEGTVYNNIILINIMIV